MGFVQPDDAQAGTITLFGMRFVIDDMLDEPGTVGTNGAGPLDDAAGSPLKILSMRFGTVFLQGGKLARLIIALMSSHPFALTKEFDD